MEKDKIINEARERIAKQNAELAALEAEVARLASAHPGPAMMAIVRALVEMVCAAQGEVFVTLNKLRFYRGVLAMLRSKGIG